MSVPRLLFLLLRCAGAPHSGLDDRTAARAEPITHRQPRARWRPRGSLGPPAAPELTAVGDVVDYMQWAIY